MFDNGFVAKEHYSPLELKEKSLHIVLEMAQVYSNPSHVREVSQSPNNSVEIEGKSFIPWSDLSMSHGFPGLCFLFGELDHLYPNDKWDYVGHEYMLEIQKSLQTEGIYSVSSFSGLTGMGYAAMALSRGGERYTGFITSINHLIVQDLKKRLEIIRTNKMIGCRMGDYDVIEGLTGVARYLIRHKHAPEILSLLKDILSYFVDLTKDIQVEGKFVPGWFVSSDNQFLKADKLENPIGNFNCGLSHGIPGPMAVMSIAIKEGIEVNGQKEAIEKIADWLLTKRLYDNEGVYFPGRVSWEEEHGEVKETAHREAWCYGSPGVGRSLFLTGQALQNQHYMDVGKECMLATSKRTEYKWGIYSPTFCHGYSGLMHIANLMDREVHEPTITSFVKQLQNKTLSLYNEDLPFKFQDVEYNKNGMSKMNKVGLLDGTVGIALPLLNFVKDSNTGWDQIFLLN